MDREVLAKEILDTFKAVNTERILDSLKFTAKGENIFLQMLEELDGRSTPSELIEKLDFSAARLSAVTKSLESKGYVQTLRNEKDKRSKIVALTPSGRDYCMRIHNEMTRNAYDIIEELGEEDATELLRIFRRFTGLYTLSNKGE